MSTSDPTPRRLTRSRTDRVIGGVCGGLARHFDIDPLVVRIAAVALAALGGVGLLAYVAALLLVPDEDGVAAADTSTTRGRFLTAVGVVALVAAAGLVVSGAALATGLLVVPLAVLALLGILVWWMISGQGIEGDWREILRRSALGLGVLALLAILALAAGWGAAAGGETVMAALVIAAGVALVVGAFVRRGRWLILPALAIALPVGLVAAADVDLDGGIGDKEYRPGSAADVRDRYELGAGSLTVDLRDAQLPPGDTPLTLDVGIGEAVLVVPRDVSVATHADIGMGAAEVLGRDTGGIDVDWDDSRRGPPGASRIVVDAEVGLGALEVRHTPTDRHGHRW